MSVAYRPQLRWLLLGPLLGGLSGSLVAFVVLLAGVALGGSATDLLVSIGPMAVLAVVLGGLVGAAVGLLVGVPLAFLVGRHLPRPVARRRAVVLGALLPPVAMLALPSLLTGDLALADADPPRGAEWLGLTSYAAASLMGGALAARAVARILPQTDVSEGVGRA